jgi:two-component system response regulator HydG
MIFTQGYPIQRDDIERALERHASDDSAQHKAAKKSDRPIRVGMTLDDVEREFIKMTLSATGGNKKEAAQMLGISRRALYDKLKKFGAP